MDASLVALVDRVTGRLRKAGRVARTVTLRLRFEDFKRATRSHTLGEPTDRTDTVLAAARVLLEAAQPLIERSRDHAGGRGAHERRGLRRRHSSPSMTAPRCSIRPSTSYASALATEAITRAVLLDRAENPRLPMLPD